MRKKNNSPRINLQRKLDYENLKLEIRKWKFIRHLPDTNSKIRADTQVCPYILTQKYGQTRRSALPGQTRRSALPGQTRRSAPTQQKHMNLPITFEGNPILHRPSMPVMQITDDVLTLIDDMFDTLDEASGIGLAAPQVGKNIRVIIVDTQQKKAKPFALINPEIIHTEGEHSCMAAALGASLVGARTFTATCSEGLAYMHEIVAQAVNYRAPIVMAVANRTLGWYWSLGPDYSDIMPEMNLGWLVNFVETNQECLDMALMNFKIAEDYRVLLPTMMSLDGFYLSYSQERVYLPEQEEVDDWLPAYKAPYPVDPTESKAWPTASIPSQMHTPMRKEYEKLLNGAKDVIKEVDKSYGETFGRSYGGLVEKYRCDDADSLMVFFF